MRGRARILVGTAEAETGVNSVTSGCSAGGALGDGAWAVAGLCGWTGGIDEADTVDVALMEPDASRVTETLPDMV